MRLLCLTVLFLALNQDTVLASVRITELRVEGHVAEGETALLGCKFDMEDDSLYSLRWYKDGREFYRYAPKSIRPTKVFYVPGVNVDLSQSSTNFVTLKHFTRESAGVYRCEVYGESPGFTMVYREKYVAVDLLPKNGPMIIGLQNEYWHGSKMDVNCTTSPSRPEAHLAWYINDQPAPKDYLQGPMIVLPTSHPYSYQAKLNLRFTVYESHFSHGVLTIKCQATIPPLYNKVTSHSFYNPSYQHLMTTKSPSTENSPDHASKSHISVLHLTVQSVLCLIFTHILEIF
ncbi:unnamed protein product [Diatraea saccharalis]|uniref:Ig-like domain-containing protein n=1 Tax=Diatraea saccharalis TaxID=40085 RepID=A0A9N9QXY6_9NEOP|nr:unnamed protein product [Diatraea saccharalis]